MTRSWKNKRVVVTGATGFVGSVLVEHLLSLGASVRAPIRSDNYRALSKKRSEIEWVEGDLREAEYCSQLLEGVDHIFHLASHRRNIDFHRKHCSDVMNGNIEMSLALIHAMKSHKKTSVTFFSSANVPPAIDVIAVAQEQQLDGYILGKAVSETLWLASSHQLGFPLLIVRPVGVYGPRDTFSKDANVIPSLMVKARDSKDVLQVWGSGMQKRVFLYVDDLVQAVFTLIDSDVHGIQYIAPTGMVTIAELAEQIRQIVNPALTVQFDTTQPEGSRSIAVLPMHPALESLQWTTLVDGLQKTYDGWVTKGK
ncbi:MAG: NAD(P)-dependent oxidoreductase [Candidatus Peribacteraceae bacterium]|nr:NAD(P)-dependent oxidoreductase [Candidatus Peribacteraceae bacterium]